MEYVVCEILGRQYLVKPGQTIEVDQLHVEGKLVVDKILVWAEDGKMEIGTPYLDKTLEFEVIGTKKEPRIRVATYKAKANYRRVIGGRRRVTSLKAAGGKKAAVKKD